LRWWEPAGTLLIVPLQRSLALALVVLWSLTLGHHALAVSSCGERRTYLSDTVPAENVWVQPSSGSHDLVRPPERNTLEPVVRAGLHPLGTAVPVQRHRRQTASLGDFAAPSRRLLHHCRLSPSDDPSA
jgi:hypothetical protein